MGTFVDSFYLVKTQLPVCNAHLNARAHQHSHFTPQLLRSSVGIVLFTLGSWWEIRSATKQQSALRDSNRTSSENSVVSPDDISINANSSDLLSDLTVSSIANINAGTTNKSIADTRRKLVWVAVLLCACLCFAMALMIYMVPPLKQWTESADALLECSLLEMSGRSPDASAISGVAGFLPGCRPPHPPPFPPPLYTCPFVDQAPLTPPPLK